jgi:hypothetical protein
MVGDGAPANHCQIDSHETAGSDDNERCRRARQSIKPAASGLARRVSSSREFTGRGGDSGTVRDDFYVGVT